MVGLTSDFNNVSFLHTGIAFPALRASWADHVVADVRFGELSYVAEVVAVNGVSDSRSGIKFIPSFSAHLGYAF